jgi:hypothetical protein
MFHDIPHDMVDDILRVMGCHHSILGPLTVHPRAVTGLSTVNDMPNETVHHRCVTGGCHGSSPMTRQEV